ncbi:MAG: hypothetical protein RLO81_18070 [Fulvivirga sp.]|uniref:hypothetical protein n=1 Tax=Fulvivirga sp. TaxID=1931237 RepID=UPI0032EBCC6A
MSGITKKFLIITLLLFGGVGLYHESAGNGLVPLTEESVPKEVKESSLLCNERQKQRTQSLVYVVKNWNSYSASVPKMRRSNHFVKTDLFIRNRSLLL